MKEGAAVLVPFLVIGGIGLLLLVVSLIVGDVFDHLDVFDGAISGTGLAIAAVVFGASGSLIAVAGLALPWVYVLALTLGAGSYLLARLVIRALTATSDGVPASTVGLTGLTNSSVSAAGGEVSLDGPLEIERRLAYSDEPIPAGARIRVVDHIGTRVKVEATARPDPWEGITP